MNDRGKLSFKTSKDIEKNEELKAMSERWNSFASKEETERDRYLRELEIQFSMNAIVEDANSEKTKEGMAEVFAGEKANTTSRNED